MTSKALICWPKLYYGPNSLTGVNLQWAEKTVVENTQNGPKTYPENYFEGGSPKPPTGASSPPTGLVFSRNPQRIQHMSNKSFPAKSLWNLTSKDNMWKILISKKYMAPYTLLH